MTGDQLTCPRVREGVHVTFRREGTFEGMKAQRFLLGSFKRAVGGATAGKRRLFGEEEEEEGGRTALGGAAAGELGKLSGKWLDGSGFQGVPWRF